MFPAELIAGKVSWSHRSDKLFAPTSPGENSPGANQQRAAGQVLSWC